MTTPEKVPSAIKWHGGKTYIQDYIHALARRAPHTHRVYAFAGGLGEALNWPCDGVSEVANDVNGDLTNFWRVLQEPEAFGRLGRILEATPFSEEEYDSAVESLKSYDLDGSRSVERAAAFFVACRQSMAGRMDSFTPISRRRTRRGMNEQVSAWLTSIEGLATVHRRLIRVLVTTRDFKEAIRTQDGPATLFYFDPPYLPGTRTAPQVYNHEMTWADHVDLLGMCLRMAGKFILSGYPSELYAQHAAIGKWNRIDIAVPNHSGSGMFKEPRVECLWSNF